MNIVPLTLSKLGLVGGSAVILGWSKQEGDKVKKGEVVAQIETDKSVVDIEAPVDGKILRILSQEGDTVDVGGSMAEIESYEESVSPSPPPRSEDLSDSQAKVAPVNAELVSGRDDREENLRLKATPAAKKRAGELGIGLDGISGTGPLGQIKLRDLEELSFQKDIASGSKADRNLPYSQRVELRPMRRALARSMKLSVNEIPQFTISRSCSLSNVNRIKKVMAEEVEKAGVRLSFNDFLIQALARALVMLPDFNAVFVGEPDHYDAHILKLRGVHIGLVVDARGGLLVPVLHDVENLSLTDIARLRTDLVSRTREGALKLEETRGASLSISNLGKEGPDRFTAIINPGESAILAVGRSKDTLVVEKGQTVVRPVSELTLTVDHRLADGRIASNFLKIVTDLLEGPEDY